MRMAYFVAILIIVVIILGILFYSPRAEQYSVSPEGIISYTSRPAIGYDSTPLKDLAESATYRISYRSKDATVYGLLTVPKNRGKVPAFIVLPGATVKKESEQENLGKDLNAMGFATLILDVRGEGETDGYYPSLEQDYDAFAQGGEPVQHKAIYDILRAYDILKSREGIDSGKIYIAGISNGGRRAIIAAAVEPGIRGVVAISAAGYGFPEQEDPKLSLYLDSIEPDNYAGRISPRNFIMLHSPGDTVIQMANARDTFSRAGEPKEFIVVASPEGFHGYHGATMRGPLENGIKGWK